MLTKDGRVVVAHSHISRDECELLYWQVAATRATVAIEVGMAFGISTVCLCDALSRNTPPEMGKRPHLVVMDPMQTGWQGLGLQQVRSAGFGDLVEFHERTSQAVLPELATKGHRVLRRLVRTDKDPAERHQHLLRQLEFAHTVALRKVASDSRRWDHYCAF